MSIQLAFQKMHGLGNDFVILDGYKTPVELSLEQRRLIADRKRGVGCDQLIIIEPSQKADAFMWIYNPDGGEAGACGNATRCVADILMKESGKQSCVIETVSGLLACEAQDNGQVRVNMGAPRLSWDQIPLAKEVNTKHLPLEGDPVGISMGNPHCVFFVEDADKVAVDKLGPPVEVNPLFPKKTNVEYVSVIDRSNIRMRVWERGAGITQACGSGACAAGVASILRGLSDKQVKVHLDGGILDIEWQGEGQPVFMTGDVAYSFQGNILL